ncbi:hypothetical protein ABW20_dc0109681 [Dactylellina cionopaga]|nr:hypothetical protein ABW20_dc0109681 [Dactylellina cionopaga]
MPPRSDGRASIWGLLENNLGNTAEEQPRARLTAYRAAAWYPFDKEAVESAPKHLIEATGLLKQFQGEDLEKTLTEFIFGSNAIEHVGLEKSATSELISEILNLVDSADFHSDEEFFKEAPRLYQGNKSQEEVVQHVQAFLYLLFALKTQPLTRRILLRTHELLMRGLPTEEGFVDYEGKYRECELYIGSPLFGPNGEERQLAPPSQIAYLMARWLNDYTKSYNSTGDATADASRLKIDFLRIHPFQDGNGRMSRMLFNAFILRHYDHTLVTLGTNSRDRSRYLTAVRHSMRLDDWRHFAFFALRRTVQNTVRRMEHFEKSLKAGAITPVEAPESIDRDLIAIRRLLAKFESFTRPRVSQ